MIGVVLARGLVVVVVRELDFENLVASGIDPRRFTDLVDEVIVSELP
jgi:hypothetical protein